MKIYLVCVAKYYVKKLGVIFDLSSEEVCLLLLLIPLSFSWGGVGLLCSRDIRMDDNVFITAPGKPNINIQLPLTKIHVIHRN